MSHSQDSDLERQEPHTFKSALTSILTVKDGEVYETHPDKNPKWYQKLLDIGVEENGIKPVPLEQRTCTQYNNLFTYPNRHARHVGHGHELEGRLSRHRFLCHVDLHSACLYGDWWHGDWAKAVDSSEIFLWPLPRHHSPSPQRCHSNWLFLALSRGGRPNPRLSQPKSAFGQHRYYHHLSCLLCRIPLWLQGSPLLGKMDLDPQPHRHCHCLGLWRQVSSPADKQPTGNRFSGHDVGCSDRGVFHYIWRHGVRLQHLPQTKRCVSVSLPLFFSIQTTFRVFAYTYFGLLLPSVPLLILGAAIGGCTPNIPSWSAAYATTGIGGILYQMLVPVLGNFGKFILVLLALSVIGNIAISMYSISVNLQQLLPFFAQVHRFFFIFVAMGLLIPFAIKAAEAWEESLTNFLAVIGYWAGCFDAVVITELVVFRKGDYSSHDHKIWNVGRKLPPGVAALGASLLSLGLVVPGMAAPWYTGPLAKVTGDIGFESAFVVTGLGYLVLRWVEIKVVGHV
ncbi:Putative Purine-cytosine permease [Podospora comata]|uniref:Purine-cytosine permease n=1 Tax=Podospora comata TaxID=48703 RepID=A0ABY6SHY1_PODCO|nr:Putative Purine-cytosine permease [Podospora comata]